MKSIRKTGVTKRILSSALAVCMIFTLSPPITAAEAQVTGADISATADSGEILLSGFAALPDEVREQRVPLGVSLAELNLPDTLEAMVYNASHSDAIVSEDADVVPPVEVMSPTEALPPQESTAPPSDDLDSGTGETETQPDDGVADEESGEESTPPQEDAPAIEESDKNSGVPDAEDTPQDSEEPKEAQETPASASEVKAFSTSVSAVQYLAAPAGNTRQLIALSENKTPLAASPSDAEVAEPTASPSSETVTINGITWDSAPLYDENTAGTYTFTAVLPNGYLLGDGGSLPEITVIVEEAEQSAVEKVIAMIDALPTMDEWTAMDEDAARAVMQEILAAKEAYDALTDEEKAEIDETHTSKLTELAEMAEQLAAIMPMAIASGTSGGCTWEIDDAGKLTIRPTNGVSGQLGSYSSAAAVPWYTNYRTQITSVEVAQGVATGTSAAYLFSGLTNCTSMDLSKLDTSSATSMVNMFNSSNSLTAIDLSNFNTANVTNMGGMFGSCSGLTTLTLGENINTANVTDMGTMFGNCRGLTSLTFGANFTTAAVTDMRGMFLNCSGLTSLDISKFSTTAVTNMNSMFSGCKGLTSLTFGANFTTAAVTTMASMFKDCSGLTTLNVNNFTTAAVTTMASMFNGCSGLTTLDVSKFTTAAVTNMSSMFQKCSGLTSLDVSKFDTAKVTTMDSMFSGCSGLTSLDVSKFNTAAVTNMSYMFSGCSLTSLDVIKFDTAAVTNMSQMFLNCEGLTSLDVSKFDTTKVTNMFGMFQGCSGLTTLDLSKFNTAAVTSMSSMFKDCTKLAELTLSATPLSIASDLFTDCPATRSLKLVDATTGAKLTGSAFDNAVAAYKAVADGDTTDNLWWGWKITPDPVAEVTINGTTKGYFTFAEAWAAVNVDGQTSTVKLLEDVNKANYFMADVNPIRIYKSANITLDLNGKTIDRGLTGVTQTSSVFSINNLNAHLIIKDSVGESSPGKGDGITGKITGGNANQVGGGVCVNEGTFEMLGGTITGNTTNDTSGGGGVSIDGGSFIMKGGVISGNTAGIGGGIIIERGTFEMYGGTISNNTALSGGGVGAFGGNVTIKGGIITGNTVKYDAYSGVPYTYGGGVYISGTNAAATQMGQSMPLLNLKISGDIQIYDNVRETGTGTVADNITVDQVYVPAGIMGEGSSEIIGECLPIISGALTGEKPIGIGKARLDLSTQTFTYITGVVAVPDTDYTITDADIAKLSSEVEGYSVFLNAEGKVEIGTPDTTSPTISATAQTAPTSGWFVADTTIDVTFSDNIGVTKLYAKVDSGTYTEISSFGTSPYSYPVSAEGEHTYTFKAEDAAGNSAESTPVTVKLDKTAPTGVSISYAEKNDNAFAGFMNTITFGNFFNKAVEVTISVTDGAGGSGVNGAKVEYQTFATTTDESEPSSGWQTATLGSDGTYKFTVQPGFRGLVWARGYDIAGNKTTNHKDLTTENTPPNVTPPATISDADKWYDNDVSFTFTANDVDSGIDLPVVSGGGSIKDNGNGTYTVTVSDEGTHSITVTVTDKAGNVTLLPASGSYTVNIDKTSPTITGITGNPTGDDWTNQDVTLTVETGSAGGSGQTITVSKGGGAAETVTGNSFTATENGSYTVTVTTGAGKTTSQTVVVNRIDKQVLSAPTLTFTGTMGQNGWYTSNVICSFSANAEETASKLKEYRYSYDGGKSFWYFNAQTKTWHSWSNGSKKFTIPLNGSGDGGQWTIADNGQEKIQVQIRNYAGTIATATSQIKIDKCAPIIGALTYSEQPANLWDWIIGKQSMVITVPVTEPLSGADVIDYVMTTESGQAESKTAPISGDEAKITFGKDFKGTITMTATDKAGNTSASKSVGVDGVIVEDNAPTVTITEPSGKNRSGWYSAAFDLTVDVTDNKNNAISGGIGSIVWKQGENGAEQSVTITPSNTFAYTMQFEIPVSTDGEFTYYVKATDNAGNESAWESCTVKLDKTAPTFTAVPAASEVNDTTAKITFTPSEGGTVYWLINPASAPSTAQDVKTHADKQSQAVTGSTESTISLSNLPVGSAQTVYVVLEDAAGNLTELKEVTFYTLQVAPVIDFGDLTVDYAGEKVSVPSGTEIYTNPANPNGSVLVPDANGKVSVTPGDTIYVRYPVKDNGNIPPSAGTAIEMPARPAAPDVKTVEQKDKQLTISPVVTGEEYVIVPKGDSPDWSKAQTGGVFTGLEPNKEYDIYARVEAVTGSSFASDSTKTEAKTLVEAAPPTTSGAGAGQDGNTADTPSGSDVDQDNITYKGGYSEEYTPSIVIGGNTYTPDMTWNEATGKGEWSYTYDIQPGDGKVTAEVIFTARQLTGITAANVTLFADHTANGNATDLKAWLDGDDNKVQAAYDNKTTGNITAVHSTSDSFEQKGQAYAYTAAAGGKTASRTVTVKAVTAAITAPADITLVKKPTDGYTFAGLSLVGMVTVTYTGDGYTQKTASVAASWTNNMPTDFGKAEGEHTFNGTAALPAWATGANTVSEKVKIIDRIPLTNAQMTLTMQDFTYGGTESTPQGGVTVSDTNGKFTYSYSTNSGSTWINALPKSTAGKIKAGTYSVKMEYSGDNYVGSKTITVTVAKKNTAVAISCAGKSYDGDATATVSYTVSGKVLNDAVSAGSAAGTAAYADKKAGNGKIVTATGITLTGTDADNYNLTAATATTTANIRAKVITPAIEAIPAQTFTGSQLTPVVTVKDGGTTLILNTDYTVAYGTNINASIDAGRVTITLKGNYSGTAMANFTINKAAAPTVANNNVSTAYADTANKTYPLTGLPDNLGTVTFAKGTVTDTNSILNGTPTVDSSTGTFSYQLAPGLTSTDNGKEAVIAITVNSTNYESFTVNVVIKVTNRTDVSSSITFADGTATYNGAVQLHEAAVISGQTGGSMTYTYATANGVLEGGKPKGAGTYTVTAVYENPIAEGSKTAAFTVKPKEVTVKADNKNIKKGQPVPAFTVSYSGFVGTDSKANTLTTEAIAACTADGAKAGSFPITFSINAVLNDEVGRNYTLKHKNGVLEVKDSSTGGGTTDSTPPEKPTEPTPKPTEPTAPTKEPETSAKPSVELPTGDGIKTVPAELTDGKIQLQTNEEKTPTGKSGTAKKDTESTVLTVGSGAVIVTVSKQDGKRMAQVKDSVAVANAVLSDHEKELVNAGEVIEIRIDVKDTADITPQADKKLVEEGMEAYQSEVPDLELGMYVDISMFIRVGDSDWNPVTSTDESIEVTIEIPDQLCQLDADFYIIRAHEGEVVLLKDIDDDPATITIQTQLFSTYAITYQTKTAQETALNTKPDASDSDEQKKIFCLIDWMTGGRTNFNCWWCWIVLAVILTGGVAGIVWKRKKKQGQD